MSIVVVGLSHRTAPVEIRDGVAVLPQTLQSVLPRLHALKGVLECGMLSTCNRTEAYLVTDQPDLACEGVVAVLSEWSELKASVLEKHLFTYTDGRAIRHLFEVASGLDSLIMGEPQIAGQVKDAGEAAMEAGVSRTILNRLFRAATEASKRARTETEIGTGAVSVSYAAVELAKKIFGNLEGQVALVLGAGEMSELTARHLVENGVSSLIVSSRTLERAKDLAGRVNGQAIPWQEAMEQLHRADVIISSTSAEDPILYRDQVSGAMQRRKNRPMFLIDIAIPRDIDPDAGELYNVFLYDIDDLESVVGANLQKRQQEAKKAEVILEEEVAAFLAWQTSLGVVPAIVALRSHFQGLMTAELDHAKLTDLTEDQKAQVTDVIRRYMNKLLHSPITRLKEVAEMGDALSHVESLAHLFNLELQEEGKKKRNTADEPTPDRARS